MNKEQAIMLIAHEDSVEIDELTTNWQDYGDNVATTHVKGRAWVLVNGAVSRLGHGFYKKAFKWVEHPLSFEDWCVESDVADNCGYKRQAFIEYLTRCNNPPNRKCVDIWRDQQ